MNVWLGGLIIVGAAAAAIVVMGLVRRRAPVGGYFADSDRAAGVFGVIGTSFAVVLAFVIFLAFESYGNARQAAGQEATSVAELDNTTAAFPPAAGEDLRGDLVCYARSVVYDEWHTMRNQDQSGLVQHWADAAAATIAQVDVFGDKPQVTFGHWVTTDAARAEARRGRLAEATPVVPSPLWLLVVFGGVLAVVYMCFYADSGERFVVQALMIGSVTAMVTASLLVVHFLDNPYENRSGSIKPVEMTRTLRYMEQKEKASAAPVKPPCDSVGRPLPS